MYRSWQRRQASESPFAAPAQQQPAQQSQPKPPDMSAYGQRPAATGLNYSLPWDQFNAQPAIKDNPAYSWEAWNNRPEIKNNPAYSWNTPQEPQKQEPASQAAYRPGTAQPVQPQSPGTPYGYSIDAPTSSRLPGYTESGPYGGEMTYGGMSNAGNYAYAPIDQRPQPFAAQYRNFDGSSSDTPNFAQRDAFIQQVIDNKMPYYGGQQTGRPQVNVQDMWNTAGDMVKNGYQNPFAVQAPQVPSLESYLSQYAPPSQYGQGGMPTQQFQGGDDSGYALPYQPRAKPDFSNYGYA